jgi:hypothetical protein
MEVSGRKYASVISLIFKVAECFRGREKFEDFYKKSYPSLKYELCIWRKPRL